MLMNQIQPTSSFQNQPSTGSFQNQSTGSFQSQTSTGFFHATFENPPASSYSLSIRTAKRKRGISAVLNNDVSTEIPCAARIAKVEASLAIEKQAMAKAPRGKPMEGVKARSTKVEESDVNCSTLHSLVKHNKAVISQGASLLQAYAQKNTSYEVQKASAISIMATAITVWGCNITEAVNKAVECTRYCAESVCTWASSFFLSCNSVSSDNVTDEYITEEISSDCGHRDTHTDTLLYS